jgi:hypothetical protein
MHGPTAAMLTACRALCTADAVARKTGASGCYFGMVTFQACIRAWGQHNACCVLLLSLCAAAPTSTRHMRQLPAMDSRWW